MFDGLLMVRGALASASLFFALKACWHWHETTETLNEADIAGLSDGRCTASLVAGLDDERKRLRGKTLVSVILAATSVIIVILLYFL